MQTDQQNNSRSTPEGVHKSAPKPALGPPHDTWAALLAILWVASTFFFVGRTQVENDGIAWTGLIISAVVGFAAVHYFQRAYGFDSRWSRPVSWGESFKSFELVAIFGTTSALFVVSPALYAHFIDDSMLRMVWSSLGMAMAIVGALRFGLGRARGPRRLESPSK